MGKSIDSTSLDKISCIMEFEQAIKAIVDIKVIKSYIISPSLLERDR